MKKRALFLLAASLLAFVAGAALDRFLLRAGSGEGTDSSDQVRSARALVDRREWELRGALRELEAAEGKSAAVLNRKEKILKGMIQDLDKTNGSSFYNIRMGRLYDGILQEHLGREEGVRMLEIGPGINLGTGLYFAMRGVQKYYGLDIYEDPDLYGSPHYENVIELMTRLAPEEIRTPPSAFLTVKGDAVVFDRSKVEYLYPHQSYDIPLPDGSLDYVFSNATLEHVSDPAKTLESIRRVLRRGGVTAHLIDFRDHDNFSKPFEFLKVDSAAWARRFKDPATVHLYMNRWRSSDFEKAMARDGFEVLKRQTLTRIPVDEKMRSSFHPDFQKYDAEDLSAAVVLLVARKV